MEARAGARGGQRRVCKPSELTPLSTLALADCLEVLPPGVVNLARRRRRRRRADRRGRARRLRRVHRHGRDRQADRARLRRARGADQPRARRQGPVHRLRRRRSRDRDRRPRRRLGRVPERRARSARRPSASTSSTPSTTTSSPRSSTTRARCASATRWPRARTSGPMVSEAQRGKVEAQLEARSARAPRSSSAATTRGHSPGWFMAPDGRHRRARADRPAARGDVRPGRADRAGALARRGDRARQRHALRPRRQRLHARPADDLPVHARDQGGHGLVQRPADRQRRRAVRRLQAVGARAASSARRASRRSRRPSTSTSSPSSR